MGQKKTTPIKEHLLSECKRIIKTTIDNAKEIVDEAQNDAQDYQSNDALDGYRNQILNKRDIFADQLNKAMEEFVVLDKVDANKKLNEVGFGAVVITDNQKLFIAVGAGKIQLEKDVYYAISPKVPIYQAIKGLKKGDTYTFQGRKGRIHEIL